MILLSVVGFLVAALVAGLIVRWGRKHAARYGNAMPQRFHLGDIPRIGRAALRLGPGRGWGVVLVDPALPRLGWPWVDALLASAPWLGVVIVVLAIAGLPHAFNIIDGYNGLAGMVALIVCLALAHVAMQVGDRALAALLVSTAAATGGFLIWNYPHGM